MIRKLVRELDAYPEPADTQQAAGPNLNEVGPAATEFDAAVKNAARNVAIASAELRQELVGLGEALKYSRTDFAENEAELQAFIARLADGLDNSTGAATPGPEIDSTSSGSATASNYRAS
ncbi:hypothetical protein [Demequina aurantiaca]|uniref:hypothetical protein n=1 Tax=Demequina aurantiaca TaxID=676200 RepID=UPI003D33DEA7